MPRANDAQDVHVEREENTGKRKRRHKDKQQDAEVLSGEELIEVLQDLADGVWSLSQAIEDMNDYCEDAGPMIQGTAHPLAAIANGIGQMINQLGGKRKR